MRHNMKIHNYHLLEVGLIAILLAGCANGGKQPNPSGTLEATEVDVSSTLVGRILQARPGLGCLVAQNDTLVVLDVELLGLQRAQTATGLQSVAAQRSVTLENIAQAERNLDWLNTQAKRLQDLLAQGSAQQQQVDEINAKRDVADLQVQAARRQLSVLDAENAKLDAALRMYDRQMAEGYVLAPIDGSVLLKGVEPGEVASPGKLLYRLADLRNLELRFYLGSTDLNKVQIGKQFPVLIDAFNGKSFTGEVVWISSEAEFTPKNAQTRDARLQQVYAVKLRIANPDGALKIGMPAEVKI